MYGCNIGVDICNICFWFDFVGVKFNENWSGGGCIEMDFFGGFNGIGVYLVLQLMLCLCQVYMDLINVFIGSMVCIGQQWDLLFFLDNVLVLVIYVVFLFGYGIGMIGWCFFGVVWMQDLNYGLDGLKWWFDLGGFNGNWSGLGDNINYLIVGNVGFCLQVQVCLYVQDKDWLVYFVVYYVQIDLCGVDGMGVIFIVKIIDSEGFEVGGNWYLGNWMFKGNIYSGKGLGQVFGGLIQFGDIQEIGGYLQVGYKFILNWSVNLFYVFSKFKCSDVVEWLGSGLVGCLKNNQVVVNLIYIFGVYEFGVEYLYFKFDIIMLVVFDIIKIIKGS